MALTGKYKPGIKPVRTGAIFAERNVSPKSVCVRSPVNIEIYKDYINLLKKTVVITPVCF